LALIRTYERFATCGQMLPEQVWDEADRPDCSLRLGQPAGSAVPLVWAHAEYLKLLRSARTARSSTASTRCMSGTASRRAESGCAGTWKFRAGGGRSRELRRGDTLRILDERSLRCLERGRLADHTHHGKPQPGQRGLQRGYRCRMRRAVKAIEWTLHWPEPDSWLGYNVEVKVGRIAIQLTPIKVIK
jgi:glucoamylase